MRKYLLYAALPIVICIFSCSTNETSKKQNLKENRENTVQVDSIQKQIREADAELKSFLKEE